MKKNPPYPAHCMLCDHPYQKYINRKMFYPDRCPPCLQKIGVLPPDSLAYHLPYGYIAPPKTEIETAHEKTQRLLKSALAEIGK